MYRQLCPPGWCSGSRRSAGQGGGQLPVSLCPDLPSHVFLPSEHREGCGHRVGSEGVLDWARPLSAVVDALVLTPPLDFPATWHAV